MEHDPERARDDFQRALELNPRSVFALQNLVHVLADRLASPEAALVKATRWVELFPDHATGRSARAILLARMGERSEAHAEAERALKMSNDPDIAFYAATAYAITAANEPTDKNRAIVLIQRAVKNGFRKGDQFQKNRDLDTLRTDERFRTIEEAVVQVLQ